MKYVIYSLFAYGTLFVSHVFAAAPSIDCGGLPWCSTNTSSDKPIQFVSGLIAELIKYVAVIAVIALMISGIMYLVSWGEDEKVKKAKTWIIWSLVWVLLSVSSWYIINLINNFYIW